MYYDDIKYVVFNMHNKVVCNSICVHPTWSKYMRMNDAVEKLISIYFMKNWASDFSILIVV